MKTELLLLFIVFATSTFAQHSNEKVRIDSLVSKIDRLSKFYSAHEGLEIKLADTSYQTLSDIYYKYADAKGKNLVMVDVRTLGINDTTFSTYYFHNQKLIKVFIQPLKNDSSSNVEIYFSTNKVIYQLPKRTDSLKYLNQAKYYISFKAHTYTPNFIN